MHYGNNFAHIAFRLLCSSHYLPEQISAGKIRHIPEEVGQLTNLEKLEVLTPRFSIDNQLHASIDTLPPTISKLTRLTHLIVRLFTPFPSFYPFFRPIGALFLFSLIRRCIAAVLLACQWKCHVYPISLS